MLSGMGESVPSHNAVHVTEEVEQWLDSLANEMVYIYNNHLKMESAQNSS